MADDDELVDDAKKKEGGSSKLMLVLTLVNTLGLGGLAAAVFLGLIGGGEVPPTDPNVEAGKAAEGDDAPPPVGMPGPIIDLQMMVINLREPGGDRYLKTRIEVEIDEESSRPDVEPRLAQVKYQIHMLLSDQRVADVTGPANMERLRKQMIKRSNAVLPRRVIINVWPQEWVIQ